MVALMTGHSPSDCGLLSVDGIAEYPPEWTLATLLRSAGYQTHAVVSNPTLSGSRLRLQGGFDTFDDKMTGVERNRPIGTRTAPETTEAALSALSRLRSSAKPWFLWVQYLEPHGPYHSPPSYPRAGSDPGSPIPLAEGDIAPRGFLPRYQFLRESRGRNDYAVRYRSSAAWALDEADRLLTVAEKKGLLLDAAVVFTSDHGEFLGEADYWFQHGIRLHPAVVHVPLVVTRTLSEPLTQEMRPVSHLDLFPTVASLLALRAPAGLPGQDLFGRLVSRRRPILVENIAFPDSAEVGVVQNGRLVIKSTESAPESFQIGRDDWPQVAGEISREAVTALDGELQRVRKLPIPTRKVPPEEIQKLRALGYIR
jgi:arylsulfatase A-like enzyme